MKMKRKPSIDMIHSSANAALDVEIASEGLNLIVKMIQTCLVNAHTLRSVSHVTLTHATVASAY